MRGRACRSDLGNGTVSASREGPDRICLQAFLVECCYMKTCRCELSAGTHLPLGLSCLSAVKVQVGDILRRMRWV